MPALHIGPYVSYDDDGNVVDVLHYAPLNEDGSYYDGPWELDENDQPVPAHDTAADAAKE